MLALAAVYPLLVDLVLNVINITQFTALVYKGSQ